MISAIVFSKDRAAQLDLLLRSINKNCPHFFEVCVLYTYSNEEFKKGYSLIQDKYPSHDRYHWVDQTDFQKDLENLVDRSNPYLCFFTDDDIVYRESELRRHNINDIFREFKDMCCISMRLGKNISIQDQYTDEQCIPPMEVVKFDDVVFWNWKRVGAGISNFFYPFSVDGHVYRRSDIETLFSKLEYDDPNQLEGRAFLHAHSLPPLMGCFETSSVVNTPINLCGPSTKNRAGERFGITLEDLNNDYLNNKIIDLEGMDFSDIKGCHQELKMEMTNAS